MPSCFFSRRTAAGESTLHDEGHAYGLQGKRTGDVLLHHEVSVSVVWSWPDFALFSTRLTHCRVPNPKSPTVLGRQSRQRVSQYEIGGGPHKRCVLVVGLEVLCSVPLNLA